MISSEKSATFRDHALGLQEECRLSRMVPGPGAEMPTKT
jgi:hypothetical protein